MQKKAQNRLKLILFYLLLGAAGVYTLLYNLEDSIVFFYPPSKINIKDNVEFRVGGLVKKGSIHKEAANKISFIITDGIKDLQISYQGILPALFRENQGIVAAGKLSGDVFIARELLTKHDENYSPPKVSY
jgi:cytochrome c-type biogenesis protein CcmE